MILLLAFYLLHSVPSLWCLLLLFSVFWLPPSGDPQPPNGGKTTGTKFSEATKTDVWKNETT
jgi:hypothetical protein